MLLSLVRSLLLWLLFGELLLSSQVESQILIRFQSSSPWQTSVYAPRVNVPSVLFLLTKFLGWRSLQPDMKGHEFGVTWQCVVSRLVSGSLALAFGSHALSWTYLGTSGKLVNHGNVDLGEWKKNSDSDEVKMKFESVEGPSDGALSAA